MIYETNETFPFKKLTLITPKPVPGGNHFSRFHIDDSPVYVQLPKCTTKQGIQTSGKKAYVDLQFTNDQERFLKWLETLTEQIQDILLEHNTQWFASEMDKAEIEETFQSPLKPYRSGQIYLMRVSVPVKLGKIMLPIFDEDERPVNSEVVKPNLPLLAVLEFQGLKYSPKCLQFEMEMKQILLLPSQPLFDRCVLTPGRIQNLPGQKTSALNTKIINTSSNIEETKEKSPVIASKKEIPKVDVDNLAIISPSNVVEKEDALQHQILEEKECPHPVLEKEEITDETTHVDETTLEEKTEEEQAELKDVDICLDSLTVEPTDTIRLKHNKEIYYKMYRDARQKAKLARDLAISSFLESKHIKNKYVLEDLSDDEDEHFFTIKPSVLSTSL